MTNYFNQRIKETRLSEADYTLKLKYINPASDYSAEGNLKILTTAEDGGINIKIYDINSNLIQYEKETGNKTNPSILTNYEVKRIIPEKVSEGLPKYLAPAKQPAYPLFSKTCIRLFNKKEKIKTLFITEGLLKAIVFDAHLKLPIIGLQGIHNIKEFQDIETLCKTCEVDNVVFIYDGDCQNLGEHFESKRPQSFFVSAQNFRSAVYNIVENIYFMAVRSISFDNAPKGIDDLIIDQWDRINEIKTAIQRLKTDKTFFFFADMTGNLNKVKEYLKLDNVDNFYDFHRKNIGSNIFKYFGTEYCYDFENDKLKILMPEAANRYMRIGDDYFEILQKPTSKGDIVTVLSKRKKTTIIDDHGKKIISFIPKYKDYIVNYEFTNYQRVIDGFYNLFNPLEHVPAEGEFPTILNFFKHIFEEQIELGLDYVQLLYKEPTQMLPILCLVSTENSTGKTTFARLLGEIFRNNTAIVGNNEISGEFNAYLLGKLIVSIDESFIEKQLVIEKIKSMVTNPTLPMTKKGKDTEFIEWYGKFILLSNNVDNFITANENDVRYWIREIKSLSGKEDPDMMSKMIKEIPFFLYFLERRKLSTERKTRAWFAYDLIKTEAYYRVVNKSKPKAARIIETELKEMFETYKLSKIKLSLDDVHKLIIKDKFDKDYVKEILHKYIKCSLPGDKVKRYKIPTGIKYDGFSNADVIEYVEKVGRTYTFEAANFIETAEELTDLPDNELPF